MHSKNTNIARLKAIMPPNNAKAIPITGITNRNINPDTEKPIAKAASNATVSS